MFVMHFSNSIMLYKQVESFCEVEICFLLIHRKLARLVKNMNTFFSVTMLLLNMKTKGGALCNLQRPNVQPVVLRSLRSIEVIFSLII